MPAGFGNKKKLKHRFAGGGCQKKQGFRRMFRRNPELIFILTLNQ
jgi:hypothetical protein